MTRMQQEPAVRPELSLAEQDSHEENVATEVRVNKRLRAGLEILLAAFDYAAELHRDVWDFAVEIGELRAAGLRGADMRWLLLKDLVDHGHEQRNPSPDQAPDRREFRRDRRLVFRKKSCFVLTEAGVAIARTLRGRPAEPALAAEDKPPWQATNPQPEEARVPTWDRHRQQLVLGKAIVKEFKVPAANQEQILAAFQEEGWPVHIDDPLPPRPDQDPKQRLHSTVNALNRNQKSRLIRFRGDGRGEGIRWELITPSENGEAAVGAGA